MSSRIFAIGTLTVFAAISAVSAVGPQPPRLSPLQSPGAARWDTFLAAAVRSSGPVWLALSSTRRLPKYHDIKRRARSIPRELARAKPPPHVQMQRADRARGRRR